MGAWAYLFEAKGIQRYILDSGRRRDLVGASELVASLVSSEGDKEPRDRLADVLDIVDIGRKQSREREQVFRSRRAGGVFVAHADERAPLERLRALWRLLVQLEAPGLEFTDALEGEEGMSHADAVKLVHKKASALRENATASLLPLGSPAAELVRRTGAPQTGVRRDPDHEEDPLDAVVASQHRVLAARKDVRFR